MPYPAGMAIRIPRRLPTQPVDVPHYTPASPVDTGTPAGEPGLPLPRVPLHRAEGHSTFDPATLSTETRATTHSGQHGALQGLIAVPATLLHADHDGGFTAHVSINGRDVLLRRLTLPGGPDDYVVSSVHDGHPDIPTP